MSTEQAVAEVRQHGKEAGKRLLTDEEREIARQHAEARDFGVKQTKIDQSVTSKTSAKRRFSTTRIVSVAVVTIMLAILAAFAWQMYRHEEARTTAERELKAYAITLNRNLPSNNQVDITSITVQYPLGGVMEVSFSQGNAHCTAPVNAPSDQHNLYWVDKVDAVPLENLASARYKCVASVPLAGIGASVSNP